MHHNTEHMMSPLFYFVILFFSGCHHRIIVDSQPVGAQIYRGNERLGTVPQEIEFWWVPFQQEKLEVQLLGYRPFSLYLSYPFSRLPLDILYFRYDIIFGFTPVEHTIILQKE